MIHLALTGLSLKDDGKAAPLQPHIRAPPHARRGRRLLACVPRVCTPSRFVYACVWVAIVVQSVRYVASRLEGISAAYDVVHLVCELACLGLSLFNFTLLLRGGDAPSESNVSVDGSAIRQRLADADVLAASTHTPLVHVVVCCYQEPAEIVFATVERALELVHPRDRLRVFLLDDGQSEGFAAHVQKRFGARVRHVRRRVNTGAKAGNLNNYLRLVRESGLPPDYVLVLDADMQCDRWTLSYLLRHFAEGAETDGSGGVRVCGGKSLAFVQLPQRFHPNDDVCDVPRDECACYHDVVLPARSAWGYASCIGTNVMFSREALEDVGGFPEDSVCEDTALSLRLHAAGWKSLYVTGNCDFVMGHCAPDYQSWMRQAQRYAEGSAQLVRELFSSSANIRIPLRLRLFYALISGNNLMGPFQAVCMADPLVRIAFGIAPPAADAACLSSLVALSVLAETLRYGPFLESLLRRKQTYCALVPSLCCGWGPFVGRRVRFVPTMSDEARGTARLDALVTYIFVAVLAFGASIAIDVKDSLSSNAFRALLVALTMAPTVLCIHFGLRSLARSRALLWTPYIALGLSCAAMAYTGKAVLLPWTVYH